ncbi:MAG: protein kinase, partial [Actinoplanes sp.]
MASKPLRPSDPRRLGDYQLIARLGEGGMGTVFLGRDPAGRPVAVKAIRREYAELEEFRARFRSEVNRVRQVPSFCTAAVLDADPDHHTPYLVVEYVDGPSLQDVVSEQGPISIGDLHSVAVGVGAALTAIHGAGVIHRDLKPTNVLLSLGLPKVIDFGLAQALEVTSRHTRTDHVVGTVAYLAPERLDPTMGAVTQAADIFAWGAVVAYAGTGRIPFGGDTPMATAARILTMPPDLSGLPKPLVDLIGRALNKDPYSRPTANEIVQELLTASAPRARMPALPAAWKDLAEPDRQVGQPKHGRPDIGRVEGGRAEAGRAEVGRAEVGRAEVGRAEVGRAEVGRAEVGRAEVGRAEVGRAEVEQPDNGRFDARELLEQLIAEGPKQPEPTRIPTPRRSRETAPAQPEPGSVTRPSRTTGPSRAVRPNRRSRPALPFDLPKRPLLYGLLALVVGIGATVTYVASGDEQPATAPPPAAPASAPASAVPLDVRGPAFFDPLDAPRQFQASAGENGNCAFAGGELRARATGASTFVCPSPEEAFVGDQLITVDLTLATAGSCAMIWFRFDGVRGYQLRACDDRFEMAKNGGAVVTSIGKAQSTA